MLSGESRLGQFMFDGRGLSNLISYLVEKVVK
jgi:hypothetical protein